MTPLERWRLDRNCESCSLYPDPEWGWVDVDDVAKLEADCKRYREALEDIVSIEERRDRGTALVATIARETLREAESTPQRRINHGQRKRCY